MELISHESAFISIAVFSGQDSLSLAKVNWSLCPFSFIQSTAVIGVKFSVIQGDCNPRNHMTKCFLFFIGYVEVRHFIDYDCQQVSCDFPRMSSKCLFELSLVEVHSEFWERDDLVFYCHFNDPVDDFASEYGVARDCL